VKFEAKMQEKKRYICEGKKYEPQYKEECVNFDFRGRET
jgi:hypothetical protein